MIAWLVACHPTPPPPGTTPTGDTSAPDEVLHDPLSMPAEPAWDPAAFRGSASCAECHPDHLAEWRTSMHAYAMVDPVFQALSLARQRDLLGTEDLFCQQCHSAIGTRGGEIVPGFSYADLSPIVMEGVTCSACHQVVGVARTWNSGHVLDPDAPVQGPLADPAPTPIHPMARSEVLGTSAFCGACHDVIESSGLPLERPYDEWARSPSAERGQSCQDCHMPATERPVVRGGATRPSRSHRWVGVDAPLVEGWMTAAEEAELAAGTEALLAGAATLRLHATPAAGDLLDVSVTVRNEIPGHDLPTGSTFLRQVWVELTAADADGAVLYRSGDLDANGDLKDRWSALAPYGDPDLVTFSSRFVDATGAPTLFPWRAAEHHSDALEPLRERTATWFVPVPPGTPAPVTVTARLRFRALPPYLLRTLGLTDAQIGRLAIHDLAEDTVVVAR